ncbi:MAG: ABC transporter ATP-binding protein, partial [Clostridia bacterium]|nr:ABC transporter ATP-binding protein [Clostridia bacterium]
DLSGGQKQRLSIAIALVNDPQIVFLDEPTTGLDPQARRNLWDTIRALKEKGKTVVLSTHYMDEAQELCDRLLVIDHGKIIAEGSPQELIRRHFDASIVEFRVGEPLDDRRAAQLGALLGQDGAVRGPEVSAQVQDVPGVLARLFTWATEAGVSVSELAVRTASLEDLFLKLTGRSLRE